ncbi:MAG: hypothetical protein ABIJ92_03730 [Candidatus Aenigmatarchaeota archaeon]
MKIGKYSLLSIPLALRPSAATAQAIPFEKQVPGYTDFIKYHPDHLGLFQGYRIAHDGNIYRAHFVVNNHGEGNLNQLWLIVDENNDILPGSIGPDICDTITSAARMCKYIKQDDLINRTKETSAKYREFLATTNLAEFTLDATQKVTGLLFSLLPSSTAGKAHIVAEAGKTLADYGKDFVTKLVISGITNKIGESLTSEKALEDIRSEDVFKDAMYRLMEESADKLDSAVVLMEGIASRDPEDLIAFSEADEISKLLIYSISVGYAAPMALNEYYQNPGNFAINHIVKPAVSGTVGLDIGVFMPETPEMTDFFHSVGNSRMSAENDFDVSSVESKVNEMRRQLYIID